MKLRDIFRRSGETKHEKAIKRQLRLEEKDRRKEEKRKGKPVRKATVALCLGGGGARGFAHIGALKAFREAGFDFDLVVGTSVGSIVGGLYAAGISPDRMWAYGSLLEVKDIRKGFFFQPDDSRKIAKIITDLAGERNIEDLPKKFAAIATDLVEGRQVILDSGDLGTAVAASSTVPLAFRPLVIGENTLWTAGFSTTFPRTCAVCSAPITSLPWTSIRLAAAVRASSALFRYSKPRSILWARTLRAKGL